MAARENFSRKREAIYNALLDTKVHPTAEWVYEILKPDYPDLRKPPRKRRLFRRSGKLTLFRRYDKMIRNRFRVWRGDPEAA